MGAVAGVGIRLWGAFSIELALLEATVGCEVASVRISHSRNYEAAVTMCTDPERSIVTVERELAFLADVRGMIRESVGADASIPTTAADTLLDELIVLRDQQT